MERLTIRNEYAHQGTSDIGHVKCYDICRPGMKCCLCDLEHEMLRKLADYEDIGLEPSEVATLLKSQQELVKTNENMKCENCKYESLNHLEYPCCSCCNCYKNQFKPKES